MSFGSCFEKHNRFAAISRFSTWFVKELSRERTFAEIFVQCLGSQMERHKGCSLKMHGSGKKRKESGEAIGGSNATGGKIEFDQNDRRLRGGR
jgi:hypothetical protein